MKSIARNEGCRRSEKRAHHAFHRHFGQLPGEARAEATPPTRSASTAGRMTAKGNLHPYAAC